MPYGIKDTSKVNIKGRRLIVSDDICVCPVCNKPVGSRKESTGLIPLAPIKIPINEQEGFESIAILGCAQCYNAQARLSFHTLDALTEYRENYKKRGRPAGSANSKSAEHDLESASSDVPVLRKKRSQKTTQLVSVDLQLLKSLYESLGKVIKVLENIAPEDKVLGAPSLDVSSDVDDIEAGMTDEQRKRMDEAVAKAKSREGKVPQEAPDGW